jgi:hypothetical protein
MYTHCGFIEGASARLQVLPEKFRILAWSYRYQPQSKAWL